MVLLFYFSLGYAGDYGKIVKYDVLYSGDSVCWKIGPFKTYMAEFLKDVPGIRMNGRFGSTRWIIMERGYWSRSFGLRGCDITDM